MLRITASTVVAAALVGLPRVVHSPRAAPASRTLIVNAYEYTFKAPDSIAAGVITVRLVDHGKMGHQLSLARLDDSSSLVRVMKTLTYDKVHTGGIRWRGGVESAFPGDSSETILALEPGRYVIVCAYGGENGLSHVSMGMIRSLTVTKVVAANDMRLPTTPVTIRLSDYHVDVTGTLHSGRQLVGVENAGPHRHHLIVQRFSGKATIDDAMKWDGKSQPAPFEDTSGGAAVLDSGQTSVIVLNLRPGRYELGCVLADDAKSKPHYMLGMHDEVVVR